MELITREQARKPRTRLFFHAAAAALLASGGAMLANDAIPRFYALNAATAAPAPFAVSEYHKQPGWAQMVALQYCGNIEQLAMGHEQARAKAMEAITPLFGQDMREVSASAAMASVDKAAISKCGHAVWAQ